METPLPVEAPPLRGPVMMRQHWCDVAFLHWAVDPGAVAPHLPPGTVPDEHGGRSWVGLIPFRLVGLGPARGPAVPWLGTFWETNVRMYSRDAAGRRGVVFASLDASRLGAVLGARAAFGLPYRWARMRGAERTRAGARELVWTARSRWPGLRGVRSRIVVRVGEDLPADAADAPLAHFLTARFGLHVAHAGRTWWVANEHEPWPLQRAEVLALDEVGVPPAPGGLLAAAGFPGLAVRPPDSVLFAHRVTTRFALPRPLP
ncbi:hypothetical protein CLV92_11267 [Kineococcus xinjiangensis]|uniref:DUF2071 domain-containing protein n=1 Tax=Kineococcus xinjiangensis TaxID=512762 RepID=A0A2S6IFA1_9ACTN|nr:DUF2071 domain-containing protein [Kineococcus xinjiangensis]PPK92894.1 hypothetical protein CLV92_11267 [Kineococcus xinjiangensis]